MKTLEEVISNPFITVIDKYDYHSIARIVRFNYQDLFRAGIIVASNNKIDGWEHVSMDIDFPTERVPNFQEMSILKDMFWNSTEITMQVFPAEKDYVNCHPYTLHLWRNVKFSAIEKTMMAEIQQANRAATELLGKKAGVCMLPSNSMKVAVCGGNEWPNWDSLHQIKKEFWGSDKAAVVFTVGQTVDLTSNHCIVLWDAKQFSLPPKNQV